MKHSLKGVVEKTGENTYRVIASTNSIDRQGDSVDQNGWELENYMANPVMLWAHEYDSLPVARAISLDRTTPGKLIADFEFATAEMNPMAAQIKALYDGGFLNAVSVGFIAKERSGNVITKSELLEISFVPVPANQDALRLAYKSLTLDAGLKATLEKGDVSDELAIEEAYQAKWENWDKVCTIMSALWTVYFDAETPVENFAPLLAETVLLLSQVAGDTSSDDEAKALFISKLGAAQTPENMGKFVAALMSQEGIALNDKTASKVAKTLTSLKELTTALEDIASSVEGDGVVAPEVPAEEVEAVEDAKEAIATIRSILRGSDRTTEAALGVVSRFMAKHPDAVKSGT